MNQQIKLSIIIPHHNDKNGIKRLLNSILYLEWIEVIVVDDMSNYNIYDLRSEYKFVNFQKLSGEKRWAGSARNLGIEIARGKYFLFADSDDYFSPNTFDIIQKYLNTECDVIYFTPTSFSELKNNIGTRHKKYEHLVKNYLENGDNDIRYQYYVPWSKLISRELVINNNIFFDEVIASNDINFSLKIGYHAKTIKATKEIIYCVTESKNSLTKQKSEKVLDSRYNAMIRYNKFLQLKNLSSKQGPMIIYLLNSFQFGISKFLYILFYCIYNKYPIMYKFKYLIKHFINKGIS